MAVFFSLLGLFLSFGDPMPGYETEQRVLGYVIAACWLLALFLLGGAWRVVSAISKSRRGAW